MTNSRYLVFLFLSIIISLNGFSQRKKNKNNESTHVTNVNEAAFDQSNFRMIGPFRGGRVTAVTGIADNPNTYFMGSTGGGVWKTTDAGLNWKNISDGYFSSASIGAVEVAPSDPNVVYVGTGSGCPRGNISIGDGFYRSLDGGETWSKSGLDKIGAVGRIAVHPKDHSVIFVAALGNPFGKNSERGVYRSKDGGDSWEKVLYLNDSTGAVDISMDVNNPRILYAAMWRVERKPWTLVDGSSESGVYRSRDGGDSWERVKNGLPEGIGGRAGVAVSPANPDNIWVIQEFKDETKGGVYRSTDGGKSFKKVNRKHNLRQRAWYYNHIHADPNDENTVYVNNTGFYKSVDGGSNFERIRTPHGDNHGLWINPTNSKIMVQCNDGGANVSMNGGKSWSPQTNQPTSEMYRVTVDNQWPYRVYGAQQDNSTISIPSSSPGGLNPKQHWYSVAGGESGHIAVDPENPNVVYAGNYIGRIDRIDLSEWRSKNVVSYAQMHDGTAPRDIKYRFQWNAPIRISPHDHNVVYHCSQYVHRSNDGGQSWEVISEDLTTNKDEYHDIPGGPVQHDHTGVELYTTIFSFEESPYEKGVLWAGTDDGRVHISRDNGDSWQEITPTNMPPEGTVNSIDISNHANGRAHMTVYRYRDNDFNPYIFQTNDYGTSWKLITNGSNGIPSDHFTRVAREDHKVKGLIYAGTEFGMYVSFNDGSSWQKMQLNLPVTPVTDMLIKENQLVVATQGRSFWVLDDLNPIQEAQAALVENAYFYTIPDAYRTQRRGFGGANSPESRFFGATFNFYLKEKPDSIRLEIMDSEDNLIRVFSKQADKEKNEVSLKAQEGHNIVKWNLRGVPPKINPGSYFSLSDTGGPYLPPGTYKAKLNVDGVEVEKTFAIKMDPNWNLKDADLVEQYDFTLKCLGMLTEIHIYIKNIREIRTQVNAIKERMGEDISDELSLSMNEINDNIDNLEKSLIQVKNESGQDPINYPPMLDDQIAYLYSTSNYQNGKPTEGVYDRYDDLRQELDQKKEEYNSIVDVQLKEIEEKMKENNIPHVIVEE